MGKVFTVLKALTARDIPELLEERAARADPEDRVIQVAREGRAAPGDRGFRGTQAAREGLAEVRVVPEEDRVAQVEDPVGAQVAQEVPGDQAVPEVQEEDRVVPAGTGDSSVSVEKL